MESGRYEFQVALPFAGEQRAYVRLVAAELDKRGISYFFDEDQSAYLWGRDLNEALQEIYRDKAMFVIMFVSQAYKERSWPTRERRAAFEGAIRDVSDRVLPVRFDGTDVPGLSGSVSYISANDYTPEQIAELIARKLVLSGAAIRPRPSSAAAAPRVASIHTVSVAIQDENDSPVPGATVVAAASTGRRWRAMSGGGGIAELAMAERCAVTVLVASPGHVAAVIEDHDSGLNLSVILPAGQGWSSQVIESTGYFEGFPHRLAPIADSHSFDGKPGRMYIYTDASSVNDSLDQPYHFGLRESLLIDDGQGHQVEARCIAFVGKASLWEYVVRSVPSSPDLREVFEAALEAPRKDESPA